MGYNDFILTVNSSSIIILLGMAAVLLTATRFRGENGYAAAIIVLPNVPVYLYNMSRMLGWHDFTLFMLPISYSANTLLMPLLWLFAKKNFDPSFRLRPLDLLHLLPG
ncbi:MAG: AraC family transcriptional regulator, partial [Parabacteroides sp.]|nr:AraC family transcriptional regulator [Parabacteroides sp.]